MQCLLSQTVKVKILVNGEYVSKEGIAREILENSLIN
jgi:hypothetical protein